jgi:Transposase
LPLLCGIDWATKHHDVAVIDVDGRVVARGRVSDDAVGFAQLAQAGDSAWHLIPVGIEPIAARGWPRCAPRPPVAPQEIGTAKPNGDCSTSSTAHSTTA